MSFSDAPTLSHRLVRLEQLTLEHADELAEAVGDLWEIWYTAIPSPEGMSAEIKRRLDLHLASIGQSQIFVNVATAFFNYSHVTLLGHQTLQF